MAKRDINLLPEEVTGVSEVGRIGRYITRITIGIATTFFLAGLGAGAYILILNAQIDNSKKTFNLYKQEIESLSEVEQRYVFVRDRVDKAKTLSITVGSSDNLQEFSNLAQFPLSGSQISEGEVNRDNFKITYFVRNSGDLTNLFQKFNNGDYKKVLLDNFNYSPTFGFTVGVEVELN